MKKLPILILLLSFGQHPTAQAQQDTFLDDFVEIKQDGHHFYISKYAVTAGDFNEYLKCWDEYSAKDLSEDEALLPALTTKEVAEHYIADINDANYTQFRLPTEAEWELAAKGTVKPSKSKNIRCINCTEPNANGLHGMLGNAWEWTSTPEPKENDRYFVIKGGDFQENPKKLTPQTRFVVSKDMEDMNIGFRLAIDAQPFEMSRRINRANTIFKILVPNENFMIDEYGITDDFSTVIDFAEIKEIKLPIITIDEKELTFDLCCMHAMQENAEGSFDEYMVTTQYTLTTEQLPLAKELEKIISELSNTALITK